ncbi:MAG: transcription termination/antitermination protein NusG [Ginsengibacter sp.]
MQKNWYIIYTKARCEKKVASSITRKKIENFFPLNSIQTTSGRKRKTIQVPLFESYVFANLQENEIDKVKTIDGVLNIVYWKGTPAIINEDEIIVMKNFISEYHDIKLEKTIVSKSAGARMIDNAKYTIDGNLLTIKNTAIKANLPSIGFTLVATVNIHNALNPEVSFGKKDLLLQ